MKESKFIELLNLYVDHQISPEDAKLLESEVESNPARRRIYRQYCQMQKACAVMSAAFHAEATADAPKTVDFKPRRRAPLLVTYATGLGAMAACLALVFVVRSRLEQPAVMSGSAPHPAQPALVMAPASHAARPVLQPAFGPRSLKLREQNAELADAATASDQGSFGGWMNNVQLSSMEGVTIDDLRFDGRSNLPAESRPNRAVRPFQGKVEMAAVRFQK